MLTAHLIQEGAMAKRSPALSKLRAKLMGTPRGVSRELFGDVGCDINDFELFNYVYFLDNVKSLRDLLKGLEELSPLADDALEVAKLMTEQDFWNFKRTLVYERKQKESRMLQKFFHLLIPDRFLAGQQIAKKARVPLGAVLIRIMEWEAETKPQSVQGCLFEL